MGMTYIRSTYFCGFVFGNAHMKHSHAKQTLVRGSSGGYVYSLESRFALFQCVWLWYAEPWEGTSNLP